MYIAFLPHFWDPATLLAMDPFALEIWNPSQKGLIDEVVIDSRSISKKNALFVALEGKETDGHLFVQDAAFRGAKFALVKASWQAPPLPPSLTLIPVKSPLKALQEIATSYKASKPCQTIALIGTHGKTMVKDLLGALLETENSVISSPESFNSQIGVALSLFRIQNHHTLALLEAAISRPGEMDTLAKMIQPTFVILTHTKEKYISKQAHEQECLKMLQNANWALLQESLPWKGKTYFPKSFATCLVETPEMVFEIAIPGEAPFQMRPQKSAPYLLDVINTSVTAALLLGVTPTSIKQVLQNFSIESRRKEIWKTPSGALVINDSDCQDPLSLNKSMKQFLALASSQRKILVTHLPKGNFPVDKVIDLKNCSLAYLKSYVQPNDALLFKGAKKIPFDTLFEAFHDSPPLNQLQVNLSTVRSNISNLQAKLPKETKIMAIVKAFAYGTDSVLFSKFLQTLNITHLGVSQVEEGAALRRSGVTQEIFTFHAAPFEMKKAALWDLQIAISDIDQLQALIAITNTWKKIIKVHLHINTGMNRLGCRLEEALSLAKKIQEAPYLTLEGVMTHFAAADDPSLDAFTKEQITKFDACIASIYKEGITIPYVHAANTAAATRFFLPQYNMVRVALALFANAVTLHSKIVGFNTCLQGESVSYGRHYFVKGEKERIAILPIGYGDGMQRGFSEKAHVLIRGKKAPMVGKVNMDYMMVDVTKIPEAKVGDPVLIFGEDALGHLVSPKDFAKELDAIVHEILSCVGSRVQRIFIDEE